MKSIIFFSIEKALHFCWTVLARQENVIYSVSKRLREKLSDDSKSLDLPGFYITNLNLHFFLYYRDDRKRVKKERRGDRSVSARYKIKIFLATVSSREKQF